MKNNSEDFLVTEVHTALSQHSVGKALDLLHLYVDKIINDVRATSRVFSSKRCDDLCKAISTYVVDEFVDIEIPVHSQFSTVFLLSEIVESGGHIELLKDYIGLNLFLKPCVIVSNLFPRQNSQIIEKFSKDNNIEVFVVKAGNSLSRLRETMALLQKIAPQKLILLNHHQDSSAIVAALSQPDCQKYFIHHADHQLCLGVTCKEFIHVDLHNVGFMDCRHELDIENRYWPIVIRASNTERRNAKSFLADGILRTCSSGNYRKFEVNNYLYDYFEILPKIVSLTGGRHIHIGELSQEILNKLKENFARQNVEWSKFEHVRHVSSVANALLNQSIDLYISSFPLAGAKTAIEAISVGIPLLMHENYRARLNGCCDLAYPEALVWRNEAELLMILEGLSPQLLKNHSEWSLRHFEQFHSATVLVDAVGDLGIQDVEKIPKLREYHSDRLETFLEDAALTDSKVQYLSSEIERVNSEWSIAVKIIDENQAEVRALNQSMSTLGEQLQTRDHQIDDLNQQLQTHENQVHDLNQKLGSLYGSRSWKLTAPLRKLKKILTLLGITKSTVNLVLRKEQGASQYLSHISQVETDFDETFYCAMYPDINANKINPKQHFRLHGKAEGRLGKAPPLDVRGAFEDFNTELETVIVVSHEATLTGAPVLAKNIVDDLKKRYNVIVILLGPGPLTESFYQKGIIRAISSVAKNSELVAESVIFQLVQDRPIKFAIVNTIDSTSVLPALAKRGIPTISLIHEFALSGKNLERFRKSYFWPEQVVFSSKLTHEKLVEELPELGDVPINILAQGKSSTQISLQSTSSTKSRRQLEAFFQAQNEECFVVLGVGTINYRKGIDLFIQCASQLKVLSPDKEFVFVWIGKNVDAELGTDYFSYLSDQIKRNNLQSTVYFFDEMADIEFAYQAADILLLSSRLDPLPNVAIDALFHGVPVICFDRASGIADILKEEGLEEACIAPFLDVQSMAEKVHKLTNSKELLEHTKQQCLNLAKVRFSMANYVAKLEQIADAALSTKTQFLQDVLEIKNSGFFRFDYATASHWKGLSQDDIIAAYVRGWRTGIDLRKPMPGFHPGIYKEKHGVTALNGDPFADFIRKGCPPGPWSSQVLSIGNEKVEHIPPDFKVALHIHAYYPKVLNQILNRISANKIRPDLFISVPKLEAKIEVENLLSSYEGKIVAIELVPNKGRDIGPLLTLFGERLIHGYDIIGHIHTKVSPHVADEVGAAWSNFLLENLLGGDGGAVADKILYAMYQNSELGLAFPDDPNPIGWDKNLNNAMYLATQLQLTEPLEKSFNFPVGTMFWARKGKLEKLIQLGMTWSDYPEEPLPIDGTILHAIERILPKIEPQMKNLMINIPNVSR